MKQRPTSWQSFMPCPGPKSCRMTHITCMWNARHFSSDSSMMWSSGSMQRPRSFMSDQLPVSGTRTWGPIENALSRFEANGKIESRPRINRDLKPIFMALDLLLDNRHLESLKENRMKRGNTTESCKNFELNNLVIASTLTTHLYHEHLVQTFRWQHQEPTRTTK